MGAKVAIADIDGVKAAACADALQKRGHEAYPVAFDVISVADTHRMVDEVASHFSHLDIFVNTVGVQREEKADEVTEENFDYVLDVNLKGTMFQAQAAAKHMIRQGTGGKQVFFGSVRSLLALRGRGFAAYCAAKGGMAILCKQLASEWAEHKINVNMVAPTFVRTQQVARWLEDPDFYRALVSRIPLGRIGEPEDVMRAVLFLVSPAADFITGQTLFVDGGLTSTQ
jgi:gluconate 5-dehydrogenase